MCLYNHFRHTYLLKICRKIFICRNLKHKTIFLHPSEGLRVIDPTLIQNTIDTISCREKYDSKFKA